MRTPLRELAGALRDEAAQRLRQTPLASTVPPLAARTPLIAGASAMLSLAAALCFAPQLTLRCVAHAVGSGLGRTAGRAGGGAGQRHAGARRIVRRARPCRRQRGRTEADRGRPVTRRVPRIHHRRRAPLALRPAAGDAPARLRGQGRGAHEPELSHRTRRRTAPGQLLDHHHLARLRAAAAASAVRHARRPGGTRGLACGGGGDVRSRSRITHRVGQQWPGDELQRAHAAALARQRGGERRRLVGAGGACGHRRGRGSATSYRRCPTRRRCSRWCCRSAISTCPQASSCPTTCWRRTIWVCPS